MHWSLHIFAMIYGFAWTMALPFVFISRRLREGWRQRVGWDIPQKDYDLWIQAASGGEAYLAVEIIKGLGDTHHAILVTTTTEQGRDILCTNLHQCGIDPEPDIRLCPLDHPLIVNRFMGHMTPRLMVLLETEIWPSLLMACSRKNCPVLLANGRLSTPSLAGYLPFKTLLAHMAPARIMAVSPTDRRRFATLFGPEKTFSMPNIKFDRILDQKPIAYVANPLSHFFKPGSRLIVLGSVREEEEQGIRHVISRILADHPTTILALVPRHMHRIQAWEEFLQTSGIFWHLRSQLKHRVKPGSVVLWDVFGELPAVYALAKNVFVGGSLAPLGGQNFLEPLAQGVSPVIGPFWKNFHWVGHEIIDNGLVTMVHNADELAATLNLPPKKSRENVRTQTDAYLKSHQGGTTMVCRQIGEMMGNTIKERDCRKNIDGQCAIEPS